jgi:hypothetical protein
MRRFLRENSLSIVVFVLFFFTFIVGQSLSGHRSFNADQKDHGDAPVTYWAYLRTGHFGEATFENWESEFLQMGSYVLLTVWLRQRGSAESKSLDEDEPTDEDPSLHSDDPDAPWPVRRGGLALRLYKNSLALAFFALFFLSFWLHAVTGAHAYSSEQAQHGGSSVTTVEFLQTSEFWFQSLQNWQSEFLAVASIVVLSIFLRQQGSPESKPVHAPHSATGN